VEGIAQNEWTQDKHML